MKQELVRPHIEAAAVAPEHRETTHTARRSDVATISVHQDFEPVEDAWRHLEAFGVATPYQRISWCRAWAQSAGLSGQERICIIVAYDSDGDPMVLLPLSVKRVFGLNVAGFPGGRHVNAGLPLLSQNAHLTEGDLERLLLQAARQAPPIDLFLLRPIPTTWAGAVTRIAFARVNANPSPLVAASIQNPQDTDQASADTRLRRLRQLLEKHGTVEITVASDEHEIEKTLDVFIAQKVLWFEQRRLLNPFLQAGVRSFFTQLFGRTNSAFQLHALRIDGAIAAVAATARSSAHSSLMFVSYDAQLPAARASPGIYLTCALMSQAALRGDHTFDFGVGDAPYKIRLGGRPERVHVFLYATSVVGRLVRPLVLAAFRIKTVAKRRRSSEPT